MKTKYISRFNERFFYGKGGGMNGNIIIRIDDSEEYILETLISVLKNPEKVNCNIDILEKNSNSIPETIIIDQKKNGSVHFGRENRIDSNRI